MTSRPGNRAFVNPLVHRLVLLALLLPSLSIANAANRYWVGSLFSNWNNILNWSSSSGGLGGSSVPGSGDVAIFDNGSTVSCTIDAAVNIAGITVNSGYTGTISQGANTIIVSGTATFSGGTFTGGASNLTVSGAFTLSGTAFTSTSGILELRSNAAFTSGSFAHNNGTVRFNGSGTVTISGTSPSLYTTEFVGNACTYTISSAGNILVANSLNLTGSLFYNLATGSITVTGDINITNTATGCGGDATINVSGTGTQNFNGSTTAGSGDLPQLIVNKSSGTLNLANFPGVSNNFTYTAGTIAPGTSTFCFTHGNVGSYTISGNPSLANVEFYINTSLLTVTLPALTVPGNLTIAGPGNLLLNTGSINLSGNLTLTNTGTGGGGTGSINFTGSGGQTADGTAVIVNQSRLPLITISKPAGTLSLAGNLSFASNVSYTAGAINPGTSTCYVVNNLTLSGSFPVNNLTILATSNVTLTVSSGSTITVNGALDLENGANYITINTGTIAAQGDIIDNNSSTIGGGSATLLISGTGAQNLTSTGVIYQGILPAVTINKPSGTLTLPSLITERSNWTWLAGTIDATTNNSTVVFGNTLTITGSHTLNNIVFDGGGNYTFTIASGTTLTASGTVTISGASNVTLNTGTINLLGNLSLTNTATAGGGSATLDFAGSGNQAITGALSMYQSSLPAVTINKSSGTLTFPALVTARGNWTYTGGALDVTTNNSVVVFGNSLTISGNHILNNVDFDGGNYTYSLAATTLSLSGNMTMSGSGNLILNNGTINLSGNLVLTNTATAGTGSTVIAFVAPVNQSIISSLTINQCNLPSININKAAGTLTLPSLITVRGNWTYTSGTIDATTNGSTVVFANTLSIAGTHTLNNVNFEGNFNNSYTLTAGTALTVAGTLTTSGASNVILNTPVAGTNSLLAQGDVIINNTGAGSGGTGGLMINGTGNQAFTGNAAAGQGALPYVTIQKTGGTLTITGTISVTRNWLYTSGTVNPSTSTVVFGGNNLTITSAGMTFNHVSVSGNTISLGNSLIVLGNLAITGAGVLSPAANGITLAGNWTNWGSAGFVKGTSSVTANGSSAQTVANPAGESFYTLIINNTGGGIQLSNPVSIANALTMTSGNIALNANTMTLGSSAASPGTLIYTTGTMTGTGSFKRWFGTATVANLATAGLFPMGTTANYQPFYITAPTTAPTTGGTLAVAYTDASTQSAVSITDGASTIQVRDDLNWTVTAANGLAGGAYNVDAQGTDFGTVGNTADLRLSLASSVVGTAGVNAGTLANPQVNRTGLTAANLSNTFYIGSVNTATTPLPVDLVYFTARVVKGSVLLAWQTATENNDDYFNVQRSPDGARWYEIARINGLGNSPATEDYTDNDDAPLPGQSFYRLVQTDRNGQLTYSPIVTVNIQLVNIQAYPNPATNQLTLTGPSVSVSAVRVLNIAGASMNVPMTGGNGTVVLQLDGLAKGVYLLQIGQQLLKFVKK